MMHRNNHILAALFTILALLYPHRVANAQIDPGDWVLCALASSSSVEGTNIGRVYVPARGAETAYTEQWFVSPDDLASTSRILEIRPAGAGGPEEDAPAFAASAASAPPVEAAATEHAIDPALEGGGELLAALRSLAPDIDSDDIVYTKEIWQQTPSGDGFALVGFIRASRAADSVTREHWLLSERYVYPSQHNGIRTQLRPRGGDARTAELVREIATSIRVSRYIHVELRSIADAGEPGLACAYRSGAGAGGGFLVAGAGLAAILMRRRRRSSGA